MSNKKRNFKIHPMAIMPIAPGSTILANGGTLPNDYTSLIPGLSGLASSGLEAFMQSGTVEDTSKRNMSEFSSTAGGAIKGGGTGLSIGLNPILMGATGGLSAPIGAALGAIGGGISGFTSNEKELNNYQKNKLDIYRALGGPIDMIEGPTHEEGGVSLTENTEAEGGEAIVGNEVLSDRLINPLTGNTFAKDAEKLKNKYKEREYDPFSQKSLEIEISKLVELNKQEREKTEALQQNVQEDYLALGGYIKPNSKGALDFDESILNLVDSMALERGLPVKEYKKQLLALGGQKDILPPSAIEAIQGINNGNNFLSNQTANLFKSFSANQVPQVNDNPPVEDYFDILPTEDDYVKLKPKTSAEVFQGMIPEYQKSLQQASQVEPGLNFDNENLALLASNLAPLDNLVKSINPEVTSLDRVNLDNIDMSSAKTDARNESAKVREILAENARSGGNSSAAVLGALAAGNSSIYENLTGALSNINLQEQTQNTEINNQEELMNNQLTNQEQEINAQNRAMSDTIQNLALSDIGLNVQNYAKDKKLATVEDVKNKQLISVISSLDPNYKIVKEKGELVIKFFANGKPQTIKAD